MNDEQNISASNASTDKPEAQPINDLQAAEINSNLLVENPVTQKPGHKETIEPVQPETINPKLQTEEMEVHHHGHVHEKKKWKEYFFQFLMLFLAVTAGFFMENQREHYVERQRAKEFATSLYDEIVNDTTRLKNIQEDFTNNSFYLDTLFDLINSPSLKNMPGGELYFYAVRGLPNRQFNPTDATLHQLINSGSLRYFRNPDLIKAISRYDQSLKTSLRAEESSLTIFNELRKTQTKIFNLKVFQLMNNWSLQNKNDSLLKYKKKYLAILTYDPALLAEFSNWAILRRGNNMGGRVRSYRATLEIARELIKILKKEYHLK